MADDFRDDEVGRRYAHALFDLAEDNQALDVVREDLRALKQAYRESADLRRLLVSPTFSSEDKGRGLNAIAEQAGFNGLTRKFIGLLAANRRASALMAVIDAFERLYDRRRGVVAATVTTAVALDDAQLQGVKAALRQALGKDPELSVAVDPTILGGLKVRVGSRLFDASLKTKLDQLKFALKRA